MVLIDVDMIATRSLAELIESAAPGRVVAFKDNRPTASSPNGASCSTSARPPPALRVLGIGRARRRDRHRGARAVGIDRQQRVDYEPSWFDRNVAGYPFRYLDQDVLNAVLCTASSPTASSRTPTASPPTPRSRACA